MLDIPILQLTRGKCINNLLKQKAPFRRCFYLNKMINSKNKPIKLTGDSNSQSKQSRIEQQIEKLTKSIDSLNKSTNSYSKRLLDLTILMAFVGLIQLCVSVFSIPISSWTTKIIVFAIILYAINWITDNIKPSKSKKITPIKKIS